ncbi:peptidase S9 family protein [Gemmatimonas aurantiaca T-27]|uniref:Peptidase S9 family protein n=2 Tax=Gemmatimonas aurantiaca TaxID=173480 RepID=C1A9B8_GEMAT|nr:peptidase S9 family protein [Gemmatimonas aurantiaca T-27]
MHPSTSPAGTRVRSAFAALTIGSTLSLVASPLALAAQPANPYTAVSRWTPPPLPAGKKPITQDTYDEWRTIGGSTLSNDGKWAVYTLSPVVGEGELVVRATSGTTEYRAPRGFTGRPQLQAGASGPANFTAQAAQVSADSRVVAFLIYPTRADVDGARRRRGSTPPRTALGILNTADGAVTRVSNVRSFQLARRGGRFLAYLLEDTTAARGGAAGAGAGANAGGAARTDSTGRPRREYGTTLVLRDLSNGTDTRIEGVTNFTFDEGEKWLAYSVTTRDGANNGAFVRALPTGAVTSLLTGAATYRSLAFDRAGTQLALVSDLGDSTAQPRFALYHASLAPAKGKTIATRKLVTSADVQAGLLIADRGPVEFTRDGSALTFSIGVVPFDSIPADSLAEKAVYDLWHWQDAQTQPQQKLNATRDRNRTFTALYTLATNKWAQLANDSIRVTVSNDGKRVLGINALEYAIPQFWGEGASDAYMIDPTTGARTLIGRKLDGNVQLSPGAGYAIWFENGQWQAYATATGKRVNLTDKLPVKFQDEEFDSPDVPPPYGIGGWTTGDKRVLIYDRFDIWEVDPSGVAAPRNLTEGEGRRGGMTFRVVNLDRDDPFIDVNTPLLLRAVDSLTKASGFWREKLGVDSRPERIVMGDRNYAGLQKARDAEQYLLTQSTYREFPDLWTGSDIAQTTKISNANPQDSQYPRGTVELVSWFNGDGIPLRGLLYKPENFDASKQYPMVVYYYEKLTDGLHGYQAPSGRNTVNPLVYNSLGYVVFMPDIVYTDGQPGPSAAKSIIPGVQSLIQKGFVDPKRIGITGQSWGGYQSAYLVTVTNMFAAAVPNATVVNMTSAYGGIRWASGLARAFQYEHTQSRIGGSLWQYPERFIENSPLFRLDRVTTPVLFMANDNDGAVPWYQGIEFYVAMRRLQKEAYMLVYNGDEHNPTKRANQKDIDQKMQDFFAVKLQGADAPSWMVRGIPYLEKGRDQVKMAPQPVRTITPTGEPNGSNGGR